MIPVTEQIFEEDMIQVTRGSNFAPAAIKYSKLKELLLQDMKRDIDSIKAEIDKIINRRKKKVVRIEE